jgi:transcription elongation factor SPT6
MAMLILEDYIADLSDLQEKELWANAPQIKEEIRYPCLDLRQSCRTPSNEEMFKIITGETDHSLYIGQKVGVEILEIKDVYNRNNNTTRRLAQCKTDSNIRGTISEYEIIDDKIDPVRFNMKDHLQEGMSVMAVIIGVQKDRFSVDLSIKPSYLKKTEDWWLANRYDFRGSEYSSMPKSCLKWWRDTGKNPEKLFDLYFEEKEALKEYLKKEQAESKKYESSTTSTSTTTKTTNKSRQPYRRAIQHPLFKNIDFKDAEEFLRAGGKGAGEVIIRPSSKGLDRLAITWAFQENMFKHIDVEERGKQEGNIGLGTELRIKEEDMRDEIYSDLDEIFSRYVMAMNDFVNTAVANRRFFNGQVLEGEEYLKTQAANNPTTIPYILRLEPNKAGYFCLSWLIKESSNPIKKELIQVRPSGYMYRKVVYPSLSEVFSRFKADQSALRSGQMPQPSSRQNPAQSQRKSRFTSNKEQGYPAIPPPPPPMQVQAYPMQGGYQEPYYNNNYQMPPPPMHY